MASGTINECTEFQYNRAVLTVSTAYKAQKLPVFLMGRKIAKRSLFSVPRLKNHWADWEDATVFATQNICNVIALFLHHE